MKFIKTEKFNHVSVSIRSIFALDIHTITTMNLLCIMMKKQTEKYPDPSLFARALADTYGIRIGVGLSAYGKQLVMDIRMNAIESQWIPDQSYEKQALDLFNQIICHPHFTSASLSQAKMQLKNRLHTQMDDPNTIALLNAFTSLAPHSISIPVQGNIDAIDGITLLDIQQAYEAYLKAEKHVYIVGQPSQALYNYLDSLDSHQTLQSHFELLDNSSLQIQSQTRDISQTSLTHVYANHIGVDDPLYYPLLVMNSLLGQSPNSLLFTNVREKHSYCYSIYSSIVRFDGALIISTSFRNQYFDQVISLIQEQIKKLQTGQFDVSLLSSAKKDLIDGLISGQDSSFSLIEQAYLDDLMHRNTQLKDRISAIDHVTKEEVIQASSYLHLVARSIVKEEEHEEV
ncbi:M16 family metallopeptidase [Absicoccus intestinalis]|uniref:Insulinase family protein n=1 Tax=Absicoccus intestinalis TaxID=2926319 RepID=A0ABU4WMU9_9FIRM|nr:insulinase family protein [Absicoccus sp. CLA-KB-P134]MDX8416860.1 insulinase family protein [Absicoccus sp. CLA-KB-P134]